MTMIATGQPQGYVFAPLKPKLITADYVAIATDFYGNVAAVMNLAVANTLTVNAGMVATRALLIINEGIGLCTVTAGAGVTIKSGSNKLRLVEQYAMATLIPDPYNADTYYLSGALA
jgi:hypothetical protein